MAGHDGLRGGLGSIRPGFGLVALFERLLGRWSLRHNMGLIRSLGMGSLPLRSLGGVRELRMGLVSRSHLFSRMGELVLRSFVHRVVPARVLEQLVLDRHSVVRLRLAWVVFLDLEPRLRPQRAQRT